MKLVIIESPFRGDIERNVRYARAALVDSISRGEAPIASHLLYTQVLNDSIIDERGLGLKLCWEWIRVATTVAFYSDLGISEGMRAAQKVAWRHRVHQEIRTIQDWEGK